MKQLVPLSEYPRPQFKRDSYICLNGYWEYAIRKKEEIPTIFDGQILVPFSPEVTKSGVNKTVMPDDYLFYRLNLDLPKEFIKDKVILHFGAVDQIAEVFVNGQFVMKHIGGFLPFEMDIKPYLNDGKGVLIVRVIDTTNSSYHSSGKQHLKPGGIWYKPQSGIYMPVWLESVNNGYIESIKITPNIDEKVVRISFKSSNKSAKLNLKNRIYEIEAEKDNIIPIEDMNLWSPENPYLYEFKIYNEVDEVSSYFAMRKISLMQNENGMKVITLNNKPYFMKGVLDQGYYEEGLLTPNSDEDYINDINLIKSLGFNVSRKHIKIESMRWYYHCDRLGLLVWQDFVNGCTKYDFWLNQVPLFVRYKINDHRYKKFFRENEEGRKEAYQEFLDTIALLYNCPCIVYWTIFNEGWGQFDAKEIYQKLKFVDPTRIYDHASGWHDQGSSDVKSMHIYKWKVKVPAKYKLKGRAYVCSECGAYILDKRLKEAKKKEGFIYLLFNNKEDFQKEYIRFINEEIKPAKEKGMSGFIYTQLSDVEEEMNGFVTYDRKEIKVDIPVIKEINESF
ncbi:MAG: glycoside hydrolase family 2 [Bacilli bacterium]|nr:glycoside hydrolase family 2 [Bacilli bacterium]